MREEGEYIPIATVKTALWTTKWLTQNYFNRIKTTFHYYSLVLNKARHADDGYKKNGPRKASATD